MHIWDDKTYCQTLSLNIALWCFIFTSSDTKKRTHPHPQTEAHYTADRLPRVSLDLGCILLQSAKYLWNPLRAQKVISQCFSFSHLTYSSWASSSSQGYQIPSHPLHFSSSFLQELENSSELWTSSWSMSSLFLFPSWQHMQRKKNAQCNSATFTVNYLPIAFDASSQTLLFSGLICLHYGMLELGILFHRVSPFLFLSLFLSLFYHFQLRLPRIYW